MDLFKNIKVFEKKNKSEKHVCEVCGAENSEIFCPRCKSFQIDKNNWDVELSPEEAVGSAQKGYAFTPPEYSEDNKDDNDNDSEPENQEHTPLRALHAVARYRYWPAASSIIASFFLLLLPLIPVGNKSAIVNADFEIVLYSLFGVLSAIGYFICGIYRMRRAVKDPFERLPICTIIQSLLLALDIVMFSLIISFGSTPHDPIALWITVSVAIIVGLAVIIYLALTVVHYMLSNTFKRRVIAEKFRRELRTIPQTFSKGKKLFIIVTGALMAVVLLLASVISVTVGTSQVGANAPEVIDMGATYQDAERALGEPHRVENNVWYYYSNNYFIVYKKIIDAEKKGKDTTALKEKLSAIEYSQLKLFFDDEGRYYLGIYNSALIDGKIVNEQKTLFATIYSSHTIKGGLEYYAKMTDGSVEYGMLNEYSASKTDNKGPDDRLIYASVRWSGVLSDYSATIPERLLPEDRRPSLIEKQ